MVSSICCDVYPGSQLSWDVFENAEFIANEEGLTLTHTLFPYPQDLWVTNGSVFFPRKDESIDRDLFPQSVLNSAEANSKVPEFKNMPTCGGEVVVGDKYVFVSRGENPHLENQLLLALNLFFPRTKPIIIKPLAYEVSGIPRELCRVRKHIDQFVGADLPTTTEGVSLIPFDEELGRVNDFAYKLAGNILLPISSDILIGCKAFFRMQVLECLFVL